MRWCKRSMLLWFAALTSTTCFGGGLLTLTLDSAPSTVNLSTEGTLDWAHWGFTQATAFDHKAGSLCRISDLSASASLLQLQQGLISFSWSDGDPTAIATTTPTGVYTTGAGSYIQFTVPADTTRRLLKIYLGVWSAQGKFEANLSDGSAAPVLGMGLVNQSGAQVGVYVLDYQAGTSGQTLNVKWSVQSASSPFGNVTLQAATLSSKSNVPSRGYHFIWDQFDEYLVDYWIAEKAVAYTDLWEEMGRPVTKEFRTTFNVGEHWLIRVKAHNRLCGDYPLGISGPSNVLDILVRRQTRGGIIVIQIIE